MSNDRKASSLEQAMSKKHTEYTELGGIEAKSSKLHTQPEVYLRSELASAREVKVCVCQ
jgi:hypothetical protein